MFEQSLLDDASRSVAALATADVATASNAELSELLQTVQRASDLLDGLAARAAAAFESMRGFEDDGCPTLPAWYRRQLRLSPAQARRRSRSGRTLEALPGVAASLAAGRIRLDHVDVFTEAIRMLGLPVVSQAEALLVDVAEACDPPDVRVAVTRLRDTLNPDAADAAWAAGFDRQQISLSAVGTGWQLTGFLDQVTGAAFSTVLNALSAPQPDDSRTSGERRVDALHALCTSVLESGLPSDKGVRPHLSVMLPVETLRLAMAGDRTTPSEPATLAGFGAVARDLVAYLCCGAAVTPFLVDSSGRATPRVGVLDVGRTQRLATPAQRKAVLLRQEHRCATPGCSAVHLEIHHLTSWTDGGRTDLSNLVGLCSRCHHLLHRGSLVATADRGGGVCFTTADGRLITDARRRAEHTFRESLKLLPVAPARGSPGWAWQGHRNPPPALNPV